MVPPQSQKGIVVALGLDGDGLRRLAMAAIQEGVSGRYSDAIVSLYDALLAVSSSPVVALNRALAISETLGPDSRA